MPAGRQASSGAVCARSQPTPKCCASRPIVARLPQIDDDTPYLIGIWGSLATIGLYKALKGADRPTAVAELVQRIAALQTEREALKVHRASASTPSEKGAKLAQTLGQFQPFIAVFP